MASGVMVHSPRGPQGLPRRDSSTSPPHTSRQQQQPQQQQQRQQQVVVQPLGLRTALPARCTSGAATASRRHSRRTQPGQQQRLQGPFGAASLLPQGCIQAIVSGNLVHTVMLGMGGSSRGAAASGAAEQSNATTSGADISGAAARANGATAAAGASKGDGPSGTAGQTGGQAAAGRGQGGPLPGGLSALPSRGRDPKPSPGTLDPGPQALDLGATIAPGKRDWALVGAHMGATCKKAVARGRPLAVHAGVRYVSAELCHAAAPVAVVGQHGMQVSGWARVWKTRVGTHDGG